VPRVGGMQLPCDHDVARGIPDPHRAPVDHAADATVPNEPVAHVQVAVVPHGGTLPWWCGEGPLPPHRDLRVAVVPRDPVAELRIAIGQRDAPARWGIRRIDPLETGD